MEARQWEGSSGEGSSGERSTEERSPEERSRLWHHPGIGAQYNVASMISQDLLALLVCPVCKKPVVLATNGQGLKCGQCYRVYPVEDDIPIMLVEAATIDAP